MNHTKLASILAKGSATNNHATPTSAQMVRTEPPTHPLGHIFSLFYPFKTHNTYRIH